MPVVNLAVSHLYGVAALSLAAACGPESTNEDGPPPDDTAWLVDSFAHGCEAPVTQCMEGHYYEFVFEPDGTVQTYDIVCGVREPAQADRKGRWQPTEEYGVAELLPREGEDLLKLTLERISHGFVRRTDDCNIVEIDLDKDGAFGLQIYRGKFDYIPSACVSRAVYLDDPPACPDA
jgi:hypothetical protein